MLENIYIIKISSILWCFITTFFSGLTWGGGAIAPLPRLNQQRMVWETLRKRLARYSAPLEPFAQHYQNMIFALDLTVI